MTIKAIIFDLDNTLIDFMRMKNLCCESAMDAMIDAGLDIDKKKGLNILFDLYAKYGLEYQKIFQKFLKEVTGKIDYKTMAAGIVAYRRIKESLIVPYPGVKSTLRELSKRGYKLAILSDAPRLQAWIRLVSMGLEDEFDVVITYDDVKKKKPDPKPFLFILKKLKLKPEEVIMVGDSLRRDVKPAKELGMKTVFAKYGKMGKIFGERSTVKPDYKIDKFNEVLDLLSPLY